MPRTTSGSRVTQREREMREFLAECERSGQSKAAFARKRKLNPATFAWWSAEIRRRDAERARKGASPVADGPAFVDVVVRENAPSAACFEVELGGGRLVRVPAGFAADDLSRLLSVVVERC